MTNKEQNHKNSNKYPVPIIGVCGGIGSGKSFISKLLGDMNCAVSCSDDEVGIILNRPEVADTIQNWWGAGVIDKIGKIDKKAVAGIVFADKQQRIKLETLIHPMVSELRDKTWYQKLKENENIQAFVLDAPLLFESGLDQICDYVIFVQVSRENRLQRVYTSRGWNKKDLELRENSQWPLDTKQQRSDYIVENNGDNDIDHLKMKLKNILNHILNDHSQNKNSTPDLRS